MKKKEDPCGCLGPRQPLDTTVPDDDPTGDWPLIRPEPPPEAVIRTSCT